MKFIDKYENTDLNKIDLLHKEYNFSKNFAKILVGRGIDSLEKVQKFLYPKLENLEDPFLLSGMKEAVQIINKHIENGSRILIFGDYDVDGMSATAILYKYLKTRTKNVRFFLPNRYEDGYGLSIESSDKVFKKYNPNLVITVDCGISCFDAIENLKSKGVEVVVTDHHDIPEILPNCTIVNPKLLGQEFSFNGLCGAGVALKVVEAFVGRENLTEYLPIAAIATIADIVPLTNENRLIVQLGLENRDLLPEGIKQLIKLYDLPKDYTSVDIAFKIAPKINAAGRLGDPNIALKLFISSDRKEIEQCNELLSQLSRERQDLSLSIYEDCINILAKDDTTQNNVIVLKSDRWDAGLLGITCAKLVEEFNRPVFLFSAQENKLTGSARSFGDINIHEALSKCSSCLETFGGHTVAAGLSLKEENYEQFKQEIEDFFNSNYTKQNFETKIEYDLFLEPKDITIKFLQELELLEPCGFSNARPQIRLNWQNNSVLPLNKYPQHLAVKINPVISIMAFNYGKFLDSFNCFSKKDAIVEFCLEKYNNKLKIKGVLRNIIFSDYSKFMSKFFDGECIKQFGYNYDKTPVIELESVNDISEHLKGGYGNLIVVNSYENYIKYKNFLDGLNLTFSISKINFKTGENCCVMNLTSLENLTAYKNIFILDKNLNLNFLNLENKNVYCLKNSDKKVFIDITRPVFTQFYKAILEMCKNGYVAKDEYSYYLSFNTLNPNLSKFMYKQFIACLYTFKDLGFFELDYSQGYKIKALNTHEKKDLTESEFYKNMIKYIYE